MFANKTVNPLNVKLLFPKDETKKPFYIISIIDSNNQRIDVLVSKGLIDYVANEQKERRKK